MSDHTISLNGALYQYLRQVSLREPEVLQQLRAATASHPYAEMQISPEQGQLLGLLVQLIAAKKTLEIGVFTGYSALFVALALPADGYIIACDCSREYTDIAQPYWRTAGVADKIILKIAPALETLDALLAHGEADSFDFAFIDADKGNYLNYYERCLQLLRPGGLIAIDNVLWRGRVADTAIQDSDTVAIRKLNDHLHQDARITLSLLPIGDGLTLAMKNRPLYNERP